MTSKQNSFLQMCAAVKHTCDAHSADWSTFAPFQDAYTQFLDLLTSADDAVSRQMFTTVGVTENKANLRDGLSLKLMQISDGLVLHGKLQKDSQLTEDAHTTKSELRLIREKEYFAKGIKLVGMAETAGAQLTPYGITTTFLEDVTAELQQFLNSIGAPRHTVAETAKATQQLEDAIGGLINLFEDALDPAASVLQYTKPDFYAEYQTARVIIDPVTNTRSLDVLIRDKETRQPVGMAKAVIEPGNVQKVTGPSGRFYVQSLAGGTYEMVISKAGYQEQEMTIHITNGERLSLGVELMRL